MNEDAGNGAAVGEAGLGPGGAPVLRAIDAATPGATATAPTEATASLSKMPWKLAPSSLVFMSPPVARPT
jgi:hypothetical protein